MNTEARLREYLRRVTVELDTVQGRLREVEARQREPIAVVGMGCRFPGGVVDPDSFWRLLDGGVDAIGEIPTDRWDAAALYDPNPDTVGKVITRFGGFLPEIDQFDAGFFGISPREAISMDPQQRLLLETSWEALERAGIAPDGLAGSSTGVFVGMTASGYGALGGGLEQLDGYTGTGSMPSVASGRISYVLGLHGPSMTVDTACSSSLATVHLGCQALRAGECSLALAGGVSLILTPAAFVEFSRLEGMAPDGRCKSFSAAANGMGWSEGCGMVVLERLSDALDHHHQVLAVIRGSAVNQDGRSNGLTAPNGPSQQRVIREALQRAGAEPADIDYVECHGTGTSLGDPIEAHALGAVFAPGRDPARPVRIGSVKSNLGHAQAAAGIAGLMKVILALRHGRIPENLHFDAPSPHISWEGLALEVVTRSTPWSRNGKPRRAGVSAFGISGTNAHLVLEEPPEVEPAAHAPERSAELVLLSARTPAALKQTILDLRAFVEARPDLPLGDLAASLATTRTHHSHRLAVVARTRAELDGALRQAVLGETPLGSARGQAQPKGLAWLFSGQGAQVPGMGRGLHAEWPVFRETLEQACACLDPHLPVALRDVMFAEPGTEEARLLDQTAFTQPALFALEVALAALWRSWGVQPDWVVGHSVGEISAAHVAGVFSLEDAARLVTTRGRLMQALPVAGAMVSIAASERSVREAILAAPRVSIAAINALDAVVISGPDAEIVAIAEQFERRGVKTRRLAVSHAFHSPLMEPMLEEFERVAGTVSYSRPRLGLMSGLTGSAAGPELLTPAYWTRQIREPVRLSGCVASLHAAGVRTYIELGPRPMLVGLVASCLVEEAGELVVLPSLRPDCPDVDAALQALGGYYAFGGTLNGNGVFHGGGRRVELPTYAWQRQRHWLPTGRPGDGAEQRAAPAASAAAAEVLDQIRELATRDDATGFMELLGVTTAGDADPRPAIEAVLRGLRARLQTAEARQPGWLHRLIAALAPAERQTALEQRLRTVAEQLLGRAFPAEVTSMASLGLDSIAMMGVRRELTVSLALDAARSSSLITAFFERPTFPALAEYLLDILELDGGRSGDASPASRPLAAAVEPGPSALERWERALEVPDHGTVTLADRPASAAAPPTLLLLHGAGANHHYFSSILELLGPGRIVIPSLPGRCRTGAAPLDAVADAARWLRALAAALELRHVVVVGHSYGGAIALEAAIQEAASPEGERRVAGLVLIAAGPRFAVDRRLLVEQAPAPDVSDVAAGLRLGLRAPVAAADVVATARSMALTPAEAARADLEACGRFDRRTGLEVVTVPVALVAGADDPLVPSRHVRFLADHLPRARLHPLAGTGHHPVLEASAAVAEVVRAFLATIGTTP